MAEERPPLGIMTTTTLTAQALRELLHYDAETGVMTWRQRLGRRFQFAGKQAGSVDRRGYRVIFFADYGQQQVGRLAWLYMTGALPIGLIDHINGVVDDNRFANLRDVSHTENLQNQRRAQKSNKSGVLGVTRQKNGYSAEISVAKKRVYLGTFKTPEEAHAAYVDAKRKLHKTCEI